MEFNQILVPAYGRDYASREALFRDLLAGRDFRCEPSGSYADIRDLRRLGITKVWIRYNKLRAKAEFDIPREGAK